MLARHILTYAFARGVPGLISLLSLYVYSRLLTPDEYGRYSMVIAGAGFVSAIFFHWLNVGLLRFLPANAATRNEFISTIMKAFFAVIVVTFIPGIIAVALQPDPKLKLLVLLGLALSWAQSFHMMNLEFVRCQFQPKDYGWLLTNKALISLAVGALLAYWGFGALGLLLGGVVGFFLPTLHRLQERWRGVDFRLFDRPLLAELLRYGLPLTATYALGMIINTSDRFILGYYLGAKDAGLYSAGYDLSKNAMSMIMMVVNLAAYPIAVSSLETRSPAETESQLAKNLVAILIIGLPAAAGMILVSQNISSIFLGKLFSSAAQGLMPLIVIGAFLAGIKSFYLDLSFQLGKCTIVQVYIVVATATLNAAINLVAIPTFGIYAAAYANITAYAVGVLLSWRLGKRVYPLPLPGRDIGKIALATAIMAVALLPLRNLVGSWFLALQVLLGMAVYGAAVYCLDAGSCRSYVRKLFRPARSDEPAKRSASV